MAPIFTTTVLWAVMYGAGAMCILGIIDDIIEPRLDGQVGQVLIAGGMAFGGVQLASFLIFGLTLDLPDCGLLRPRLSSSALRERR